MTTSALDYSTERQVCLNLASAFRDRTVFSLPTVATISRADVILMMNQGKVVEQGTCRTYGPKGRYYCLYQRQEAQL